MHTLVLPEDRGQSFTDCHLDITYACVIAAHNSTSQWFYIMAGRAFVAAKEVFIMETVVFCHCDNGLMTKNNSFGVNPAMSIIICTRWLISITLNWDILNRAIFSPNVHWCANQAFSRLLRALTLRIIWNYQSICQRLSLPLYNTQPTWLAIAR